MLADEHGHTSEEERRRRRRRRLMPLWIPCAEVCCLIVALFAIAVVVVASLIPLFLARKGDEIVSVDINDLSRALTMSAATSIKLSGSETIVNFDQIAKQVNDAAGYNPAVLGLTAAVVGGTARRRKRQDDSALSCDDSGIIHLYFKLLRCPGKTCVTASCYEKCVETVKNRMRSVFGSKSKFFEFISSLGRSYQTPLVLCSFDVYTQNTTTSTTTTTTTTTSTTTTTTTTSTTPAKPKCADACCVATTCIPCVDDNQPSILACDGAGDGFVAEDCSGTADGYYSNGGGSGAGSCAFTAVP